MEARLRQRAQRRFFSPVAVSCRTSSRSAARRRRAGRYAPERPTPPELHWAPNLPSSGTGDRTTMAAELSVTRLVGMLKGGDGEAAQRLWEAYFGRLVALARAKLRGFPTRAAD